MPAEVYVSTDVEADGPIPGPHSMLSFASAAFVVDRAERTFEKVGDFSRNLVLLDGARPDPATREWWRKNAAAYEATRQQTVPPERAMPEYVAWLEGLEGRGEARRRPVFVGYPASYDFMFVYWYLIRFAGSSPFSHSALDVKTLAMARLGCGFREVSKRTMPRRWFGPAPHTHVALDDAIEQGELFCRILLDDRGPGSGS